MEAMDELINVMLAQAGAEEDNNLTGFPLARE